MTLDPRSEHVVSREERPDEAAGGHGTSVGALQLPKNATVEVDPIATVGWPADITKVDA